MRYVGLSKDGIERLHAASSPLLKWSVRFAALALLSCALIAAYVAAAQSVLSGLENTRQELGRSLSDSEKEELKTKALEQIALRVAKLRRSIGEAFNPKPVFAALCMALRPDVCLKSLELAGDGFTPQVAEMSGIDGRAAAEGFAYELRLVLHAESGQAAGAFVDGFCEQASQMYSGGFSFGKTAINECGEAEVSGKSCRIYEVTVGIEKPKEGNGDGR